jgi:hypothetical protein
MADMADRFTLAVVTAAIVSVGALIAIVVFTRSYVRAINAIWRILREKKPPEWERGFFDIPLGESAFVPKRAILLVLGVTTLSIGDDDYRRLLWTARRSLVACAVVWVAWVAIFGWLFRSPA